MTPTTDNGADVVSLDGLFEFADELRNATSELLEESAGDGTQPSDELLLNGRAVALAIQELGARLEILTVSIVQGMAPTHDMVEAGLAGIAESIYAAVEGP